MAQNNLKSYSSTPQLVTPYPRSPGNHARESSGKYCKFGGISREKKYIHIMEKSIKKHWFPQISSEYSTFLIKWEFDKMGIWSQIFFRIAPNQSKMGISYSTSRFLEKFATLFSIKWDFHKNSHNFRQPETKMGSHFIKNVLQVWTNFRISGFSLPLSW